ncbi:DUF6416 domain-containing protein [Embleya sp. NPDC020886]|uniref:DUF6416 domain-containing protein n=1 Tax=Embleya sp. NPDC020886 TaxID=3363980 RepID=UPI0037B9611C
MADPEFLDDDDAEWSRHTGGSGHDGREWGPEDGDLAAAFHASLNGKSKSLFDLFVDHPGRRLTTHEITELLPELTNPHSIAASLSSLAKPREEAERQFPFRWWKGDGASTPTRYAMKTSVSRLFAAARN